MISQDNTMLTRAKRGAPTPLKEPPTKKSMFDDDFVLAPPPDLPDRSKEVRCAKTWERGVEYEPDDSYPIVMKPSSNCSVKIGDKLVYIQLPEDPKWLDLYIKSVERFTPQQLLDKNGTFTWMIYRKAGSNIIQFSASKVRSMFEVGTLHRSIAKSVGAKTIHGAGEMKKTGNRILYNFLSGSYVANWIDSKDRSCTVEEMENFLVPKFKAFFPGLELVRSSTGTTFITTIDTPVTMEELQLYADAQFKVCLHDSRDTCKAIRGSCENPLKSSK
jgi:hypothetical protein